MKKVSLALLCAAFIATSCNNNPKGDKAQTTDEVSQNAAVEGGETYTIDPSSSTVTWTGSKVTGAHTGTIDIESGKIMVVDGKVTAGEFSISMKSLVNEDMKADAENKIKLENHLKSEEFFAAEKYPTSTFVITEVKDKGDNKVDVSGNLTLKGITKNITFSANITQHTNEVIAANADFNVNRKDWGVMYEGMKDDLIANEINLKISLTAKK